MDRGLDVAFAETQKPFTEMGSIKAKGCGLQPREKCVHIAMETRLFSVFQKTWVQGLGALQNGN